MDINKINTIVLSGGGIKGICYIGAFKSIFDNVDKEQIKHYICTSAGAMFSLCLILDYNLDEIKQILIKYDFNKIVPDFSNIDDLFFNYGISDGNELRQFISEIIEYKLSKDNLNMTFLDLYNKTNIKFTITTTNFTKQTVEYWNYETTPNKIIIDGIMATTCVPLFFKPLNIENDYYLDGSIINNYPIDYIPIENIESVIGICLTSKKDLDEIKMLFNTDNKYDKIITYMYDILMLTYTSKLMTIDKRYLDRTIRLESLFTDFLDVNISPEYKNKMIDYAFEKTNLFFENFINSKLNKQ